jgi:hypothetical protein
MRRPSMLATTTSTLARRNTSIKVTVCRSSVPSARVIKARKVMGTIHGMVLKA